MSSFQDVILYKMHYNRSYKSQKLFIMHIKLLTNLVSICYSDGVGRQFCRPFSYSFDNIRFSFRMFLLLMA